MIKRIPLLLIDDDENLRELLEYSLRLGGFEVYLAGDGPSGLLAAQKHMPKVILLDRLMPGMDGLEVLSELKHDKKTERIPVFMLTAKSAIGEMDDAYDIGADDYITKPIDPKILSNMVKKKLIKYN